MSRRTHRKSRNGCVECKQRHVKCDETLPACVSCITAGKTCSFSAGASRPHSRPHSVSAYPSPADSVASRSPSTIPGYSLEQDDQQYNINLDHIFLLYHFHSEVAKDLWATDVGVTIFDLVRDYTKSAPYLIHQLLAVSALHLSFRETSQQEFYQKYATGLQTKALTLFNQHVTEVDQINCVPVLIFSSTIGVHVFCNTVQYHSADLNNFLQSFTHCLKLRSEVRRISHTLWNVLQRAENLRSSLEMFEKIALVAGPPGSECAALDAMLTETDLGVRSLEIYQSTVKHLQWTFDMTRHARDASESKQMLLLWTVMVPPGYIDLLNQQRPEALIILAYYGVLLLAYREFWVVRGAGSFLIRAIRERLGQYWDTLLAWPMAELERVESLGIGTDIVIG